MVADSDGLSVGYRDDSRCARSSSLLSPVRQHVLTLLRLETAHRHVIESSSITEIYLIEETGRLLVLATNTLYSTILDDLLPSPDPNQWTKVRVLPFFPTGASCFLTISCVRRCSFERRTGRRSTHGGSRSTAFESVEGMESCSSSTGASTVWSDVSRSLRSRFAM